MAAMKNGVAGRNIVESEAALAWRASGGMYHGWQRRCGAAPAARWRMRQAAAAKWPAWQRRGEMAALA